jgi:hypothetical protein
LAIAPLIVRVTTSGVNQLRNLSAAFRRAAANMRVSWNRAMNNFIARGGLFSRAAWAPVFRQMGQFGARAGQAFTRNFGVAMESLGPIAAVAIAGAAPFIAGALNAAILLALGGGVLAAGIAAAVRDPAVSGAFAILGDRAKNLFKDFGEPFKEPLIRAAKTFGDSLDRIAPSINRMGAAMAPLIDKLAPAFAEMAEKAMPGIVKAVEASIPLFEQLAAHAPAIGQAISDFFEVIAESGPAATRVFSAILTGIEFLLPAIGGVINVLSNLGAFLLDFQRNALSIFPPIGSLISSVFSSARDFIISAFGAVTSALLGFFGTIVNGAARAFGWIPGIGPKLQQAAAEFNAFAARVNAAINGIQKTVTITVRARLIGGSLLSGSQLSGNYSSGAGGRASGGPVTPGRTYLVGEEGPELVTFGGNGYVHNASASRRMMAGAPSGGWTGGGAPIQVLVAPGPAARGNPMVDLVLEMFRRQQLRLTVDRSNRVVPA